MQHLEGTLPSFPETKKERRGEIHSALQDSVHVIFNKTALVHLSVFLAWTTLQSWHLSTYINRELGFILILVYVKYIDIHMNTQVFVDISFGSPCIMQLLKNKETIFYLKRNVHGKRNTSL